MRLSDIPINDMSQPNRIHIISFQSPYPANYGGAIDVYYKAKALKENNIYVILHCFEYNGRGMEEELYDIADEVYMYPRKTGLKSFISHKPYIVKSRTSSELIRNLLKDNAPILFEGLHTTAILTSPELKDRLKIVRTHNVETEYFKQLYFASKSLYKRLYYLTEHLKLKFYEPILKHADVIMAITEKDKDFFARRHPQVKTELMPCFHNGLLPSMKEEETIGRGNYILYNGNLSIEENIKAVMFLMEKVIPFTNGAKWIIAGREPHSDIINAAKMTDNVEVCPNPTSEEMDKLIREAASNVLITFQSTGIKLKLLGTLFKGGHCIANKKMLDSTGLSDLCILADTPTEIINAVNKTIGKGITEEELSNRNERLLSLYDNNKNIQILCKYIAGK